MSRRATNRIAVGLAMVATLTLAGPAEAGPAAKRLSLEDCVRIATEHSQPLERADAKTDEAQAARRKLRGRFGPAVIVEAGIQRWDDNTEIEFALPNMDLPITVPPIAMEVQEQTTRQLSFTVAQPVTGLWAVYEGHLALSLGEDAAVLERDAMGQDVGKQVADAYFQALTAEKMTEIAELSQRQLEAHVDRARKLNAGGLLEKNKLLEAEVRLVEVKAAVVQARGGVTLARSNLAFRMGLPASEPVPPALSEPKRIPGPLVPYRKDADRALHQRPELAAARTRVEQAEAGHMAAWAQMLPELNLVASAQYAKGSSFQKEEAYFIGAQLKWPLWEWGSTYYGIDEAKARVRQARSGEAELGEAVKLQVRKARVDLDTASRKVDVMEATVSQAEENLRLNQRRFAQDANTSTDVLDAEALLARARTNLVTAQYEAERARVALRHAIGSRPVPVTSRGGQRG